MENTRNILGDEDFTFYRLRLLETVNTLNRLHDHKQAEIEQKKADKCLNYLMNHRPHQQEF